MAMPRIRVAERSQWVTSREREEVLRLLRRQAMVDRLATIPILLLIPALLLILQPAAAAGSVVTVSPDHSLAGQKVRVVGVDFASGEEGMLAFDAQVASMPGFRASAKGEFRVWLTVPPNAAPGSHEITARAGKDGAGPEEGKATFVVDGTTDLASSAPTAGDGPSTGPSNAPGASADPGTTQRPTEGPVATQDSTPAPAVTLPPATSAPPAPTAAPNPIGDDLGVRAYYYLWWSTNHWHDKLGSTYPYDLSVLPLPATTDAAGCSATSLFVGNQLTDVANPLFTQDDASVLARDVQSAKAAGLRGFLLNWGGTGSATQTTSDSAYTRRFAAMLAASRDAGGFTNWLSYKTSSLPGVTAIVNDAAFIYRTYGSDSAWGRIGGKPVFILTGSRKYSTADLADISTALRPDFFLIGDESYSTLSSDRLALFDGLSYYWSSQNPYTNPNSFSQVEALGDRAHAAGKPWLAPLTPGYNSQLLRGGSCVPRNDGQTMQRIWAGNAASQPEGWTLISWNEIAENTHVQPLTKWGDRYLDVLADLIGSR
jgi:hypothetical protein